MKLLVLGGSGMAGHVIATYFQECGHSVDTIAANYKLDQTTKLIDVSNKEKFIEEAKLSTYDIIINCIGVLVRDSENEKERATYLNSYLPRLLEKHCEATSTKVIHISTDGVFSGIQSEYSEDSPYDGQSFYSRSKALGEINNNKDLTIRTSIIGPELSANGRSLFGWFYGQKGEIQGYTGSFWKGVTTIELAKAIDATIKQDISGIYHLSPDAKISKFDLLTLFGEVFQKNDSPVTPTHGSGINSNLRDTRKELKYELPDYPEMIRNMHTWIQDHQQLYPHYDTPTN